jgi:hypothetical protein
VNEIKRAKPIKYARKKETEKYVRDTKKEIKK